MTAVNFKNYTQIEYKIVTADTVVFYFNPMAAKILILNCGSGLQSEVEQNTVKPHKIISATITTLAFL